MAPHQNAPRFTFYNFYTQIGRFWLIDVKYANII